MCVHVCMCLYKCSGYDYINSIIMTEELSVSSKENDKADMRLVQAAAEDVSADRPNQFCDM